MNLRRPDIAIFLPSLRGGGAERVMVTLANSFAARGLEVDLVLAQAEGPYLPEVSPAVRIVNLDRGRVLAALVPLARYMRRDRPGAMLSALNHANVVAILARALARVNLRLVVSEHTTLTRSAAHAAAKQRLLLWLVRRTYPRCDAIVGVSRGVSEDTAGFLGLSADRVSTIYNPVVTDDLITKSHEPLQHPWLAPGSSPVVLSVGRLTAAKDYPTLIRAFATLRAGWPCRLVILGEGELRGALTTLSADLGVADDVALPGFVANPYAWMRRAQVFVLSSAWEGLPTVLIEAMACGARVVSTDCPSGPAEILGNGRWGRLVPVGNAPALAQALSAALSVQKEPNYAESLKQFSSENAVGRYLEILLKSH